MKIGYIELAGEKHPLCFSLSATEEICEKFGSLDGMGKALEEDDFKTRIGNIDSILTILMKGGRRYCEVMGQELPLPLPCRPADVLGVFDKDAIAAIRETISRDSARTVEAKPKKADPAPAG